MRDLSSVGLNVSRETIEKLEVFETLVQQWNPKINLIARSTLNDLWVRHICDSAQVFKSAPKAETWLDIGSGGGFPGIVIAILAAETNEGMRVTLVESDKRKCAFLMTAVRKLDLQTTILAERIEKVPAQSCEILSARALASLSDLMDYGVLHLATNGAALFQKGQNWKKELKEAEKKWSFEHDVVQSITDNDSAILKVRNIKKR